MRAVVVDDEKMNLDNLTDILSTIDGFSSIKAFQRPLEAMEYLKHHYADVVFLDVRMPGLDGITMAHQITEFSPDTNIIFATGYTHYLAEAFALHASGYILKPITRDAVVKEVKNLRFPPKRTDRGLRVQTFGKFSVFYDGTPVEFEDMAAMEIFAYIVDGLGEEVSLKNIAMAVYGERPFDIPLKKEINAKIQILNDMVTELGGEGVIVQNWGKLKVDKEKLRCDLYDFLDGKPAAISMFNGCYMLGYNWAEERLSEIIKRSRA